MGTDADIVRRLTDEVFIGGDLSGFDELVAADFVDHDPPPGVPADREGQRQLAGVVIGAFSDRKLEFDEYVETKDGRVVQNWAMVGSHTGAAFDLPASGQPIRVRGVEIFRCADGKIVEHWGAVDLSDVFEKAMAGAGSSKA